MAIQDNIAFLGLNPEEQVIREREREIFPYLAVALSALALVAGISAYAVFAKHGALFGGGVALLYFSIVCLIYYRIRSAAAMACVPRALQEDLSRGMEPNALLPDVLLSEDVAARYASVRVLLARGADPNRLCDLEDRCYPLEKAARIGDCHLAHLLLEHGANINMVDREGRCALTSASTEDVVQFLIDRGANYRGTIILARAERVKLDRLWQKIFSLQNPNVRLALAAALLEEKADPNCVCADVTGRDYFLPLEKAARMGEDRLVALLLEHGADTTRIDQEMRSPLTSAPTEAIARLLVEKGVDFRQLEQFGSNVVSRTKNQEVALYLLQHPSMKMSHQDVRQFLLQALHYGWREVVLCLLQKNSQMKMAKQRVDELLPIAKGHGWDDVVALLEKWPNVAAK